MSTSISTTWRALSGPGAPAGKRSASGDSWIGVAVARPYSRKDGRDGRPGFSGMRGAQRNASGRVGNDMAGLGGWAVGGQPHHLPMGLGRELPKGEFDLVLNAHLHPPGKEDVEQTTLALYFARKKPLDLPAGTKIEMEIVFDNSKDNPSNPFDPPRRVGWGLQSTEEMAGISLLLISKDRYKSRKLAREIRNARNRGMRSENMIAGMIGQMASRIRDYDKDGDGFVELSDLPQSYQRFVGRFDRDGDGKLSSKEIDDIGR